MPIRAEPQSLWANIGLQSLARRRDLTAYDVAYLDLAMRTNLPLATSDRFLKRAAVAEGVTLVG